MSIRAFAVAAAIAAVSVSVFAQGPGPRRDGNWEIKMQMEMPGMPQAMPPVTTTQCITKEMASDPKNTIPQAPGRGARAGQSPQNCKMTDYKMDGNTATFTMKCDPPQQMTMAGTFTYAAETYEGTMKMDMDRSGQPMTINMKISGKRLGDCTK